MSLTSQANLHQFEKPALFDRVRGKTAHIAVNIKGLYKDIKAAALYRQRIVSHEYANSGSYLRISFQYPSISQYSRPSPHWIYKVDSRSVCFGCILRRCKPVD
ncbi:hypothetical protein F5B22DRAFT_431618 [Xylaria bambusicola]|uniref:uncharacterized protein n=1 Tax=Xylaria bambusicola TaxID=326684 RepID=UPI0020075658|nr:uncharacterized protein F5B22DRAFT_431618 [Xylaria bambusicola]KAI0506807.1 hypothetical protein F5B22DRAFT_431618 [Xylaria bambusicola]